MKLDMILSFPFLLSNGKPSSYFLLPSVNKGDCMYWNDITPYILDACNVWLLSLCLSRFVLLTE